MDSPLPPSKRRVSKKSTLKTREILEQIKQDVKPLFKELFDDGIGSLKEFNSISCKQDPSLPTLIYLSRHLLSQVNVVVFGVEVPIIPIFINLTADSFIGTGKGRLVNPGRIAVYFLHDEPEGGVNFSTCMVGAITISKQQNNEPETAVEITKTHHRRIEV